MVKTFFHYNTKRGDRKLAIVLGFTAAPLLLCSVAAVLVVLVNMRAYIASEFFMLTVQFVAASVCFGILFSWAAISFDFRRKTRNIRYSFIDVGLKEIVFSKYAGEYIRGGKRIVLREVSIIALEGLSKLGINEKNGRIYLFCEKIPVRRYLDNDEKLMYRFVSGKAIFDDWWYNENCSEQINEICLPPVFGNPEILCDAITGAKKRFDNIPPPKKYVHKEPDFVKKRKAINAFYKINKRFE